MTNETVFISMQSKHAEKTDRQDGLTCR